MKKFKGIDNSSDVQNWNTRARHFCMKRGLTLEQADDLIQEAWLIYLNDSERFEGRSQLTTYLFGILKFKILECHRKGRRASDIKTEVKVQTELTRQLSVVSADPERRVWEKQMTGHLRSEFHRLPVQQRRILIHKHEEFFHDDEISKLDTTEGNANVLYHRCRKHLQGRLGSLLEVPRNHVC